MSIRLKNNLAIAALFVGLATCDRLPGGEGPLGLVYFSGWGIAVALYMAFGLRCPNCGGLVHHFFRKIGAFRVMIATPFIPKKCPKCETSLH
jgi:hypothetical protein